MLEYQLVQLLTTTIQAGMTVRGIAAQVLLANQPRQQGVPSTPVIYMQFDAAQNVGWVGKKRVINNSTGLIDKTEMQRLETRVKIFALAPQTPANANALKGADYAGIVARSLQSDVTIAALAAQGVGIRHITDVQTLYFSDDKVQNEENSFFEIILAHGDSFTTSSPGVIKVEQNILQGI
jgi:hypothetical protein